MYKELPSRLTLTKIDTVNNIIAGTFEFTLLSEHAPGVTLKVTDGRFDLRYFPQ